MARQTRAKAGSAVEKGERGLARERRSSAGGPLAKGILIGRLVGLTPNGCAVVALGGRASLERVVNAGVLGTLEAEAVGGLVAVMFEAGRSGRPMVLGPVLSPGSVAIPAGVPQVARELVLELDGRKLVLTGQEEVVLRCGPASITLTSDGRIAIRGVEVLSRSSGANKIRGGAVQIN